MADIFSLSHLYSASSPGIKNLFTIMGPPVLAALALFAALLSYVLIGVKNLGSASLSL
jgi:hypothetical protein